ncbi:MAG: heat-shock protein Hsp70, partial [Myxococcota bacterium]|nr:heat-shock protein Hsp70 [Myxococcota bacterium]
GPHLLLGGDNMDLALAHACEPRLAPPGSHLDAASFSQLASACRAAKETLLGAGAVDEAPVTLIGRGGSLVGGSRVTRLSREEVERIVLDGFLPTVLPDVTPVRTRGALVAFGLPYERDVAITRHIAAFLARHRASPSAGGADFPNVVLLNGGVFRAERIAERLVETLSGWRGGSIHRLADVDPDLAVARGAVAYARARLGRGPRIGGGIARGYFVGVASPDARSRAVCVVPRCAEEGASHVAEGRVFGLVVGRPVRFDLLASAEVDARPGEVVDVDEDRFARLPPLTATVGAGSGDLRVTIEGELTPIGTLDLACVEVAGSSGAPRRFRLAFQLREPSGREELNDAERASVTRPRPASPQTARRLETAMGALERAFGRSRADASGREAKDLLRELERFLGERQQWTMDTNRSLFDALVSNARARRRSADHERVFWLLAGWCIRPGFGDALDAGRVTALSLLFDERLSYPAEARGWQQFWIAWRRAAPGLDEATQRKVRGFADGHLAPAQSVAKRPKKPALALDDALDLAASLERVPVDRRVQLGGWVLERTWTDRDPRLWSAIGRIGSRVPAYASVHHVAPPHAAERWLDHLLREKWAALPTAAQAAVRLARRTGDRARDIAEGVRREVEQRLVASGASEASLRAVREVVPVEESERVAFFGDALPPGLRLVD